jgi:hypothetical protein
MYQPTHSRAHPNGYVYEHILIAEQILGRQLLLNEVVHHIDGSKLNNDPTNIAIMSSQSDHVKLHLSQGNIPLKYQIYNDNRPRDS